LADGWPAGIRGRLFASVVDENGVAVTSASTAPPTELDHVAFGVHLPSLSPRRRRGSAVLADHREGESFSPAPTYASCGTTAESFAGPPYQDTRRSCSLASHCPILRRRYPWCLHRWRCQLAVACDSPARGRHCAVSCVTPAKVGIVYPFEPEPRRLTLLDRTGRTVPCPPPPPLYFRPNSSALGGSHVSPGPLGRADAVLETRSLELLGRSLGSPPQSLSPPRQ